MAHHLARLVYRMLRYGQSYVEKGIMIIKCLLVGHTLIFKTGS